MKKYRILSYILCVVFLTGLGCEGGFEPENNLTDIQLILPINNEQCLGTNLANGRIRVEFDWSAGDAATSYTVEYEDTVTNESFIENSTESTVDIDLEPGTLYRWRVVSRDDSGNSRTSEEFSFYTEGLATENHIPFPAVTAITANGDGTYTLSWVGTDLDDDIAHFNVFFSNENPPSQLLSETILESTSVNVASGETYYLNVRTVDENGNFSDSRNEFAL